MSSDLNISPLEICLLQMFGSSGYLQKPPGSTLDSYVDCFEDNHQENKHIKTIANLDFVECAGRDPHHFLYMVHPLPPSFSLLPFIDSLQPASRRVAGCCALILTNMRRPRLGFFSVHHIAQPQA